MTPRDFAFFLSQFRALDQNNFYSGKNGFSYKEEEKIDGDTTIVSTFYPDGTVDEMQEVEEDKLNHRPRKTLGRRTPHKLFYGLERQPKKI